MVAMMMIMMGGPQSDSQVALVDFDLLQGAKKENNPLGEDCW